MATYLELVPDNHILVIISLYTSHDDLKNRVWGDCWIKHNVVLALANRRDSYEMKKYMIQQFPFKLSQLGVDGMLRMFVFGNNLIGVRIMVDNGAVDRKNISLFEGGQSMSSLQFAAYKGYSEIVKWMIYNLDYSEKKVLKVSDIALRNGHLLLGQAIRDTVKLVIC